MSEEKKQKTAEWKAIKENTPLVAAVAAPLFAAFISKLTIRELEDRALLQFWSIEAAKQAEQLVWNSYSVLLEKFRGK